MNKKLFTFLGALIALNLFASCEFGPSPESVAKDLNGSWERIIEDNSKEVFKFDLSEKTGGTLTITTYNENNEETGTPINYKWGVLNNTKYVEIKTETHIFGCNFSIEKDVLSISGFPDTSEGITLNRIR